MAPAVQVVADRGEDHPVVLAGVDEIVDLERRVVAAVDPLDPDRPTVRVPQGRTVDEVKVDMTEPPAVLAQAGTARAPLPG